MKTTNVTTTTAIDQKNLSNVKINLSKSSFDFEKDGIDSSRKTNSKSIYKGMDSLGTDDRKIKRRNIRKDLKNFVKDILGKDRSPKERETAIQEFLIFYKENWISNDFKIETFTETNNDTDRKDYLKLLNFIKSVLEG